MDLNKTIDFDAAFDKLTSTYNKTDKLKIIQKIARIEGTRRFNDNLSDKKRNKQYEDNAAVSALLFKENKENSEFTTRRQVLAIHYLLKIAGFEDKDKSEKARFIQFLTGKEADTVKIKDTYIYKVVISLFPMNDKHLNKDLQFIRAYFEHLGLKEVVDGINKEINSK
jgi:hypothetical protein